MAITAVAKNTRSSDESVGHRRLVEQSYPRSIPMARPYQNKSSGASKSTPANRNVEQSSLAKMTIHIETAVNKRCDWIVKGYCTIAINSAPIVTCDMPSDLEDSDKQVVTCT